MQRQGPPLEKIMRRLAEAPEEVFAEPRIGATGRVHVDAVVADLLRLFSLPFSPVALAPFGNQVAPGERNRLSLALLLCWLIADDSLRAEKPDGPPLLRFLNNEARELAAGGAARRFVADPERREELSRLALARLGLRPAGETRAQAQDRLASLNSAERSRLLEASRAAEKRAREIREALAKKAAQEAADKWTRE